MLFNNRVRRAGRPWWSQQGAERRGAGATRVHHDGVAPPFLPRARARKWADLVGLGLLSWGIGCSSGVGQAAPFGSSYGQTHDDDDDDDEESGDESASGYVDNGPPQRADDSEIGGDNGYPADEGSGSGGEGEGGDSSGGGDDDGVWGTTGTSTASGGGESGAESNDSTTSGPDSSGGPAPGCPMRWPEAWLFCEDFESSGDLRDVFFEYQDGGGLFVQSGDQSLSGHHSMRATFMQGVESAGWLSLALGDLPDVFSTRPIHAPGQTMDDLYWRVWIRTEYGWPEQGVHRLTSVLSVADADFGHALMATVGSDGEEPVLRGDGTSCVLGDALPCGNLQEQDAEALTSFRGVTRLFSSAYSDEWHCVEGHVRLNEPGMHDGVFEIWVDNVLDGGVEELTWRRSMTDFGLNLLTFENFWSGGAPYEMHRWFDDIVVSTRRIGCG